MTWSLTAAGPVPAGTHLLTLTHFLPGASNSQWRIFTCEMPYYISHYDLYLPECLLPNQYQQLEFVLQGDIWNTDGG